MVVRLIKSQEALELRQKVLRPDKTVENCIYPDDDSATTFHVGAVIEERIVGIATFLEESFSALPALRPFRLRGMATDVNFRKMNIGRAVLEFGIEELKRRQADLLWCNARQVAFDFYEKLELKYHGPLFDMKDIGPHKVMYKYF